jgi:hypothetical protein
VISTVPFLYVYDSPLAQAQEIRMRLEAAGIECELKGCFVRPIRFKESGSFVTSQGIELAHDPHGVYGPFPWAFVLGDPRSGTPRKAQAGHAFQVDRATATTGDTSLLEETLGRITKAIAEDSPVISAGPVPPSPSPATLTGTRHDAPLSHVESAPHLGPNHVAPHQPSVGDEAPPT